MAGYVPYLKKASSAVQFDFSRAIRDAEQARGQTLLKLRSSQYKIDTASVLKVSCVADWSHQSLWNESKAVSKELMKHKLSPVND